MKWDIRLILLPRLSILCCFLLHLFFPSTVSIYMFLRQEAEIFLLWNNRVWVCTVGFLGIISVPKGQSSQGANNKQHQLFSWNRIYYPPLFVLPWHFSLFHIIQSSEWSGSELQEKMVQWWISHWSNYRRNRHPSHQRNMHTGYTEQLL